MPWLIVSTGRHFLRGGYYCNRLGKTKRHLPEFPLLNLKTFDLSDNLGIASARNRGGARQAEGEIIVLIDYDTEPGKDWLSKLRDSWKNNTDAAGISGIIECTDDDTLSSRIHADIINRFINLRETNGSRQYVLSGNGSYL